MRPSKSFWLAAVCVVGVASFYSLFPEKVPSYVPPPVEPEWKGSSRFFEAQPHTVEVTLRGVVAAWRKATLCARTPGTVEKIVAERGASVKKDDPIVCLSADDRQEKVEAASAQVNAAQMEQEATKALWKGDFQSRVVAAQKQAALDKAIADEKAALLAKEFAVISAPFDGQVGERFIEIGDTVNVGTKIATLADLSTVRIIVYCSEKDLSIINQAKEAIACVAARDIPVTLVSVSSVAEEKTHMYRVDVQVDNATGLLADGMTAEVRVKGPELKAHYVPSSALCLSDEGAIGVKVKDENGVVGFSPVQVLSLDAKGAWVAGLPEKVNIIIVGQDYISIGETPAIKQEG
ncbi:MAG: efflux RND transporter periplasmic adaptor subunit [Holosporales bacterium]|jgi:multidrug efflux system membrane fusion protein|nr:efflux RND transporter periplasmic adaptor subunit [Holosporales bacterium]